MAIDVPSHSGEDVTRLHPQIAEAKRLSTFYRSLGIAVYQANDYNAIPIGVATVVKQHAVDLARKARGRVYVLEDGLLVGYC